MGRMQTSSEAQSNDTDMDKHVLINIGRQFGSGGKSIATELGRKLDIPVYDNELLAKAAEESGVSLKMFSKSDEKRHLWGLGYGQQDGELFKIQSEAIRRIASEGSAIFVGRASDYVLRDMECLDVFICAPMEVRRKTVAQRLGISEQEAEELTFKKDKGRAEYYNFFTFGHWGKASGYDLCIDSSLLGIEGTADFIIEFGKKANLI